METEGNSGMHVSSAAMRKLRAKAKKSQSMLLVTTKHIKKKKNDPNANKTMKAALKKKKKNLIKKISNQIDFNTYKKIFCSTFSKDSNSNPNFYKSNFHNFYTQVKMNTEDPATSMEEEKTYDMANFFKSGKECINLKTLEKTQKIFESTMDLLEKDASFVENFDVAKVSSNISDMKIKLDQCRKIIQKHNLNQEQYNNNINQKDESIEQLIFTKRLKLYESFKQESNLTFDNLSYRPALYPKENQDQFDLGTKDKIKDEPTESFIRAANKTLEKNKNIDDKLIDGVKGSQLDFILKISRKEEIDAFLKEHKMAMENINMETLDASDGSEQSLGWKIFKNLIVQYPEGGHSTRTSLDIIGTKERFRTQKKNSDFFYYETSSKKNTSLDSENKKTPRDKASHKKKATDSVSKSQSTVHISTNHKEKSSTIIHLTAEKVSVQEKQESETQQSQPSQRKRSRIEFEDSKILRAAESLIEDYRDVLQHTFRNLNSKDPNFIRHALMQDGEIERKAGMLLNNLPQVQGIDGIFPLDLKELQTDNCLLNIQTPTQPDWAQQSKSIYTFTSPFPSNMIQGYTATTPNNVLTPPPLAGNFLSVPAIINSSPQLPNHPPTLKSLDSSSSLPSLTPPPSFHSHKGKLLGDPIIPDLRTPPQLVFESPLQTGEQNKDSGVAKNGFLTGNFAKKDSLLDKIINADEGSNINYYNIFNSMDQGEKLKRPVPYHAENMNEKSIKKNNIILTQNSFSNA